ncbi:MAG: hypothetical protein ACI8P0_003151 [Planctomycetaceae bacterium]|jgi:hypothetical protein
MSAKDPFSKSRSIPSIIGNEAREDAIVKRILKVSGTAVLVLGGAHDLSDNVPEGVRLIEVTVKAYPRGGETESGT